jgi:phosphoribosylformylglycinamidine synthase
VALAESCISQQIARNTPLLMGATIDLSSVDHSRLDALLFGETQARIVISSAPANVPKILMQAKVARVPAIPLGVAGGNALKIKVRSSELHWELGELYGLWWNSIARAMQ